MTAKNTPLKDIHRNLGAKMVDFHGWNMPVLYNSIIEEHKAVREKVGIFDICHMGQAMVTGEGSFDLLQKIMCNDLSKIDEGMAQYTALLNDDGGVIDDLLVHKVSDNRYFLCLNASNTKEDVDWMSDYGLQYPLVEVKNVSRDYGMISLQGPLAKNVMKSISRFAVEKLSYYHFQVGMIEERNMIIARTGYTGEDGFEIYCDWRDTAALWTKCMAKGKQYGIKPIGLGARDTLRMEMKYPLHGQELGPNISALESGLGWIAKMDKPGGFVGKEALLKQKEDGVKRRLVGISMVDRGIPREGYAIYHGDDKVGVITSGTMSPTLGKAIGIGFVHSDLAEDGAGLAVEIRGRKVKAVVNKKAFVDSRVLKSTPVAKNQ